MQSYFIWNGVDSRNKGIILSHAAPLIRPEERAAHVQIPGRSGDLTEIEGDDVYNSYIQTLGISVTSADRVHGAFRWLRGDGFVTFSGEPAKKQAARVIGAVTLEKVSRNMDHWRGQVQFYCQPLKQMLAETPVTLTAGGTILNNGDVDAYPIILAYPSLYSMTITVNGESFSLSNAQSIRRIDSDAREVTDPVRTILGDSVLTIDGYYIDNTIQPGTMRGNSSFHTSDMIPAVPGSVVTFIAPIRGNTGCAVAFYATADRSSFISGLSLNNGIADISVTAPAGAKYVSFSYSKDGEMHVTIDYWDELPDMAVDQSAALYTIYSAGAFPVLHPGSNTIGGSGWSKLVICKRERYL